jgi:hypothetical protein
MPINKNRVIEINNLGRFYVYGSPTYSVIELPNVDKALWGFIIVADEVIKKATPETVGQWNAVYKLNEQDKPIAKLLVKNREMAEEIAYAANRIRV